MPRSKRAKVVHLTQTEKKGKELSEKLFTGVREAADEYQHIFVLSVENMRNNYLKEVRAELADSRIFFGKTKVMAIALGKSPASEHLPNLSQLTPHISGNIGLLFTSREPQSVLEWFAEYAQLDFARAGVTATRTVTVPAGILYSRIGEIPQEDDVPVPHSQEVVLRKWGMPTRLEKGKVMLDQEWTLCTEGQSLNSNQTALLKMFGIAMAEFKVNVVACWSASSQEVTVVNEIASMQE